jgi:hypothetical protein
MDPFTIAAAIASIYGSLKSSKKSKVKTVSYADALAQAQAAINPSYATNLRRSLASLNTSSAARGVSGQDRTKNQMAAQVSANEADRSAKVAEAAQSIMNGQNATNLSNYQAENEQSSSATSSLASALASLGKIVTNNGARDLTTDQNAGYTYVQAENSLNNTLGINSGDNDWNKILRSYTPSARTNSWNNSLNKAFNYNTLKY